MTRGRRVRLTGGRVRKAEKSEENDEPREGQFHGVPSSGLSLGVRERLVRFWLRRFCGRGRLGWFSRCGRFGFRLGFRLCGRGGFGFRLGFGFRGRGGFGFWLYFGFRGSGRFGFRLCLGFCGRGRFGFWLGFGFWGFWRLHQRRSAFDFEAGLCGGEFPDAFVGDLGFEEVDAFEAFQFANRGQGCVPEFGSVHVEAFEFLKSFDLGDSCVGDFCFREVEFVEIFQ